MRLARTRVGGYRAAAGGRLLELRRQKDARESVAAMAGTRAPADHRTAKQLTFSQWLPEVTPLYRWDWAHLRYQQAALEGAIAELEKFLADRTYRSTHPRGILFLTPPRHGKTEQNTIRLLAYLLERIPRLRTIVGAHSQTYANKLSRAVRRIVNLRRVPLSADAKAVQGWQTLEGGGLRAAGVKAAVAGEGADVIVVDDPIANREKADSPQYREVLWQWFKDDIWTRRDHQGTIVLVTVTPWHQDDLVGRIQADPELAKQFLVVRLPANAEANDPLGRPEGAALCPDRFDEAALASIRATLGEYSYSGLYQCRPIPAGGLMFKGSPEILEVAPLTVRWCRGWDKAGSKDKRAKYTAGVKVGVDQATGRVWIGHVVRDRWEAGERELRIKETAQLDGFGIPIVVEQEPASGGKESAQATVVNLGGWAAYRVPSVLNKEARARPLAAQWQSGNVTLLRGGWNQTFLEELRLFPSGTFTDQVDAAAIAYNYLTQSAVTFQTVRTRQA